MNALATLLGATTLAATAFSRGISPAPHQEVPRDTIPPAVIAQGKAIFEGKGGALCVTCHGKAARGVTGLGPDLTDGTWLHGDGGIAFIQEIVRAGVMKPKQSGAVMPPMGGASLKPEQLRAIAAYVYSLNSRSK